MSYDIYLYEKQFLKRALAQGLGDWRGADPIPVEKRKNIREMLSVKGYLPTSENEFEHPNQAWGLQVLLFEGEVSFGVAYWDNAETAIAVASSDARQLAEATDLGFYDPQTGEALT